MYSEGTTQIYPCKNKNKDEFENKGMTLFDKLYLYNLSYNKFNYL